MKVLILADAKSSHIMNWINSLLIHNIEIFLFTLSNYNPVYYSDSKSLQIYSYHISDKVYRNRGGAISKIVYLKTILTVKKIINEFKPDILHSHYASSYGLIGALTGFHPYIVSVWGSDIYVFARKNFLNKLIIKYNLYAANIILSTSKAMVDEINKYSQKKIEITPFGIDLNKFIPSKNKQKQTITIGTIKNLESIYGIDILLKAYQLFKTRNTQINSELLIIGEGSQRKNLVNLAIELNIDSETIFAGFVPSVDIVEYFNKIDIFVNTSRMESFGVAVLEASACEIPVIVSNVGGLPEVIDDNLTGFLVNIEDPMTTSYFIEKLALDRELCEVMGGKGRKKVLNEFSISFCVDRMIDIYKRFLKNKIGNVCLFLI